MKLIFAFLFLLFHINAFCNEGFSARNSIFFGRGYSYPFYGHWGDKDAGFKRARDFKFMYIRDIDENISYGVRIGYSSKYENRSVDLNLRIFSFVPILFSWLGAATRKYFVFVGSGIYHITQPETLSFPSDSITEFGINVGTGALYNFFFGLKWGISLEWQHIFNMEGDNFKLDSANNFNIGINFIKIF